MSLRPTGPTNLYFKNNIDCFFVCLFKLFKNVVQSIILNCIKILFKNNIYIYI